jgi:hypothetical protein
MESLAKRNLDTTALTACILGLVTCPFPYIAIGALSHFAFSLTILPPFLIGSGFLLWRYRARPAASAIASSMPKAGRRPCRGGWRRSWAERTIFRPRGHRQFVIFRR